MKNQKSEDTNGPRSGHIRVDWMCCPNKGCASREFEYWDVDFEGEIFVCGTCEILLRTPCFIKESDVHKDSK